MGNYRGIFRLVLISAILFIWTTDGCKPDVKFEKDHHRRRELEEKIMRSISELKKQEEALLKAANSMKEAHVKTKGNNDDSIEDEETKDYKERIAQIEKELLATKQDHERLVEKHNSYMETLNKPKTWSETIQKWTGDAMSRLIYNVLCGAAVVLIPLILRPFQRRWFANHFSTASVEERERNTINGSNQRSIEQSEDNKKEN